VSRRKDGNTAEEGLKRRMRLARYASQLKELWSKADNQINGNFNGRC
jgi:hypothetical protein